MAEILPGNGLQSTLTGAITSGATTLSITSSDAAIWPTGGEYRAVLCTDPNNGPWELVRVTGGQGTANLTVTRAVESYNGDQTAKAWPSGTYIAAVLTHDSLQLAAGSSSWPAGSVDAPGWPVTGDLNTGLYQPAVDKVAVSAGGVPALELASNYAWVRSGTLSIGTQNGYNNGAIYVGGQAFVTGNQQYGIYLNYVSGAPVGYLYGIYCWLNAGYQASPYTITVVAQIYIESPAYNNTNPTNAYGLYVANQNGGGNNTNVYGVYIANQTGATTRNIGLFNAGTTVLDNQLLWNTDNTYDLGVSGANRPRRIYAGTAFMAAVGTVSAPSYSFANSTGTGFYEPFTGYISAALSGVEILKITPASVSAFIGHFAVGANYSAGDAVFLGSSNLTGGDQWGVDCQIVASSAATSSVRGFFSGIATANGTFTVATFTGFWADPPYPGSGVTLTNVYGFYAANQGGSGRTNVYGVYIEAQSGASTTNLGLYNAGTSQLGSNVSIGSQPPNAARALYFNVVPPMLTTGGSSGYGIDLTVTFPSNITNQANGLYVYLLAQSASYNISQVNGIYLTGFANPGAATFGSVNGIFVSNMGATGASNVYGIMIQNQSGGSGFNIGLRNDGWTYLNSFVGIGNAPQANTGVFINHGIGSGWSGGQLVGIRLAETFPSSATTSGYALDVNVQTQAVSYTLGDARAIYVEGPNIGSGSSITNNYGIRVGNQGNSSVTAAYGIKIDGQSGGTDNRYNCCLWTDGPFAAHFGGYLVIDNALGFSPDPGSMLIVAGATHVSSSQYGIQMRIYFDSAATAGAYGIWTHLAANSGTYNFGNRIASFAAGGWYGGALPAGVTATTVNGVYVANHGNSAITNAYGIYIDAQSGATSTNLGLYNLGTTRLDGNLGIGIAPGTNSLVNIQSASLAGATQSGMYLYPTFTTAATTSASGLIVQMGLPASFTEPWAGNVIVNAPVIGTSGVITNLYGLVVNNLGSTKVTNATGVWIGAQSGATGQNIGLYNQGTTQLLGAVIPPLYIGSTSELIRNPVNTAGAHLSLESRDGYAFVVAALNSHVTSNLYWDGTNWLCVNTANPGSYFGIQANGITWQTAPAASGTVTFTTRFTVSNSAGPMTASFTSDTVSAQLTLGPSYGIINTTNGSLYLRSSNGNYIMDSGGDLSVTGSSHFGGWIYANSGYMLGYSGSYYINLSSNICQIVSMNLLSWGWVGFSGNSAINWSWNGGQLVSTHSIINSGNYYYFANTAFAMYTDGSWIRFTGGSGIGTSGSYVWMANNSGVGMYWDGTWVNIQPRMWSPNEVNADIVSIRNQSSGLRFTDDNVREVRPASTNQLKTYVYDAWHQWHRTWDGASMGYVDINGFHNGSTIKNKHNLRDFSDGLTLVNDSRIKPRRYTMTDVPRGKGKGKGKEQPDRLIESEHVGFIAEELAEVIPEVVGLDHETGEPVGINYGAMVPILWDAVRVLSNRIQELEAKVGTST